MLFLTHFQPVDEAVKKTESSDNGKISKFTVRLDAGDSIKLVVYLSPDDADVSWSSFKSSVASGKITAKCGSSSIKIKVIVE